MEITIMNLDVFLPKIQCVCTDITSNSAPLDYLFTFLTDDDIFTCVNNIKLVYYDLLFL